MAERIPDHTPVVVVAPTPPPVHGVAAMTGLLIEGLQREGRLAFHVDSRDTRSTPTMGRLDLGKAMMSMRLLLKVGRALRCHPASALYVPISQSPWGLLRDAAFLLTARALGRTRIIHLHGGNLADVLDRSYMLRKLLMCATKGRTIGWVLTPSLAPQLRHLLRSESIEVLENAVPDVEAPSTAGTRSRDDLVNLVFLSNLRPGKGHDLLLSSLEQMGGHRARFRVRLAGGGPPDTVASVTKRVQGLSAEGWDIRYLGSVTAATRASLLAWADVLVMPTQYQYEGQPLVILEALSAACAVIATRHGGIPDTVQDGREGRLVAPDAGSLEAAIVGMVADPAGLSRSQRAARTRYEAHYTPEVFFAHLRLLTGTLDVN